MKVEKILVPLDGSALAEAALPTAIDLATSSGARLFLVRAAHAHTLPGVDPTDAEVKVVTEAERYLDEVKRRLAGAGGPAVDTVTWCGPPAVATVEAAPLHTVGLS